MRRKLVSKELLDTLKVTSMMRGLRFLGFGGSGVVCFSFMKAAI